ncbi:3'-5' exonuclease [Nocardia sp. CDC160]|uniref:3'-5' exonuclease n=1 Tax=Nocardia sp. CDC160 TaxID=3112166 RepID=UPI002DBC3D16|nr:3'-5' exonuclease [Nocardia sp. CDC160]MEC3919302.1 3'-5' exonuclease [Nocardia sp. CDC160]
MTTAFTEIPAALRGHDIAVVDVEGNGQTPPEIIEIAIVPAAGTVVSLDEVRSWLVRPKNPITPIVTRKVHGITNDDVAQCPPWEQVSPTIGRVMFGRTLVAHNATVEHKVLSAHLPEWKPLMVLDTLRLAKKIWPGLKSYSLDKLIEHAALDMHGLDDDQAYHRAGYDAWAAWQLLCRLVRDVELDWDALVQAAGLPEFVKPAEPEGGLW